MSAPARTSQAQTQVWLMAAGAIALLLQIELVFNRPGNWDEFYHLTQTHAFVDGRLTEALQVFYARAFFWIALLPLDAIDQLRTARLAMLAFELFTTAAIYAMASRFTDKVPAAFAALTYLTAGYVFQHGFSFRADPMAAAFLMGALWILLVSRLSWLAAFGAALLVGLAVLTTIKVVFYAPAFAGIAWLRWKEAEAPREAVVWFVVFTGAATVISALLAGLTMLGLPQSGPDAISRTMSSSASMVFADGLFPAWPYIFGLLASAPILAVLLLTAPMELARAHLAKDRKIALVALMLPLASVVLYRNSFPYFYAYILPPAMVATAVAAREMLRHVRPQAIAALLVLNAAVVSYLTPRDVLASQRQVINAVHEIFPQPVAYFDFPGMIVDFPKANFFMSTWGIKNYWLGNHPMFIDIMRRQTVPLILLNSDTFELNQLRGGPARVLLPADAKALREGFIEHWGPIWVAGHRFPSEVQTARFEIFAPGTYTFEGEPARIDGRLLTPGQSMNLERGFHRFERRGAGDAALRWGEHLTVPAEPFVGGPVLRDF